MFDRLLNEQDVQDIQQEARRKEIEALEAELLRIQQEELQAQQQQPPHTPRLRETRDTHNW